MVAWITQRSTNSIVSKFGANRLLIQNLVFCDVLAACAGAVGQCHDPQQHAYVTGFINMRHMYREVDAAMSLSNSFRACCSAVISCPPK